MTQTDPGAHLGRASIVAIVGWLVAAALLVAMLTASEPAPVETPRLSTRMESPLWNAQAGEVLVVATGDGSYELVYRVVSVSETHVEVERIERRYDSPVSKQTYKWSKNGLGLPEGMVIRNIEQDWVKLEGRQVLAWKVTVQSTSMGVRAYWFSADYPVSGIIKAARVLDKGIEEDLALTAVRWQFAESGQPERPR